MGRSLRGRFSGVVRYTEELVRALAPKLLGDLNVFVTRAEHGLAGNTYRVIEAPFPTPNEWARFVWEQTVVPLSVSRLRPDVYHSPNYILPVTLNCPAVVTVHDLTFTDSSVHRLRSHLYISALTSIAMRKASRVICVSDFTRRELIARFPALEERVRVIDEGIDDRFQPADPSDIERFTRAFGIDRPYVLAVGTIEPRKNIVRLIEAFGTAVQETGSDHVLVIAGATGWKYGPVLDAYEASPVKTRIVFTGYVPDDLLPAAYSGADVVAYASLCEGFGLPALEAMGCGAAVLTSDSSSLPEVVGDAAVLVDPRDTKSIAAALAHLLTVPEERRRLGLAGLRRSANFRWNEVAEDTLSVYMEAAG